jgi:hypothetical protein
MHHFYEKVCICPLGKHAKWSCKSTTTNETYKWKGNSDFISIEGLLARKTKALLLKLLIINASGAYRFVGT